MINEKSLAWGRSKSCIRELAGYAYARKAEIGAENVVYKVEYHGADEEDHDLTDAGVAGQRIIQAACEEYGRSTEQTGAGDDLPALIHVTAALKREEHDGGRKCQTGDDQQRRERIGDEIHLRLHTAAHREHGKDADDADDECEHQLVENEIALFTGSGFLLCLVFVQVCTQHFQLQILDLKLYINSGNGNNVQTLLPLESLVTNDGGEQ